MRGTAETPTSPDANAPATRSACLLSCCRRAAVRARRWWTCSPWVSHWRHARRFGNKTTSCRGRISAPPGDDSSSAAPPRREPVRAGARGQALAGPRETAAPCSASPERDGALPAALPPQAPGHSRPGVTPRHAASGGAGGAASARALAHVALLHEHVALFVRQPPDRQMLPRAPRTRDGLDGFVSDGPWATLAAIQWLWSLDVGEDKKTASPQPTSCPSSTSAAPPCFSRLSFVPLHLLSLDPNGAGLLS